MSLCECGCGGEASPGKRFISGHNARVNPPTKGKKYSKESKEKRRKTKEINRLIREGKLEPKYCECGCGMVVKTGKRFIHGHRVRVNHPLKGKTKETHKGLKKGAEKHSKNRKIFFASEKGQQWLNENWRGINSFNYGRKTWNFGETKETDDRVSKSAKKLSITKTKFFMTEEGQQWLDNNLRGKNSPKYGKKSCCTGKTKELDKRLGIAGEKISVTRKIFFRTDRGQQWLDENWRDINSPSYGKHHTKEAKQKQSKAHLGKSHSEEHLRKILKSVRLSPNKKEQYIGWLLQEIFPNEYKFVGDGSVIIGGKCPDFININGQKKLIELFGDYWRRNDDEGNRVFQFKLFGFDTLVVWEHELKDNNIEMTIAKIMEFHFRDKR